MAGEGGSGHGHCKGRACLAPTGERWMCVTVVPEMDREGEHGDSPLQGITGGRGQKGILVWTVGDCLVVSG